MRSTRYKVSVVLKYPSHTPFTKSGKKNKNSSEDMEGMYSSETTTFATP